MELSDLTGNGKASAALAKAHQKLGDDDKAVGYVGRASEAVRTPAGATTRRIRIGVTLCDRQASRCVATHCFVEAEAYYYRFL